MHFVGNFKMEAVSLALVHLPKKHTAEYLAAELKTVMTNWEIPMDKVSFKNYTLIINCSSGHCLFC